MNIDVNPRELIGGNNPPINIVETLAEKYKRDLDQAAELKDAASAAPSRIDDDETEAKVSELILKMRGLERVFDDAQKAERKPFNDQVKTINGFFLTKIEPLAELREKLKARSGDYLDRKAAAERCKLEEEVEKKREEARVALAAAQKAEAERLAAENARKEEERKAEVARLEKEKAEQAKRDAEARAEAAKAEEKRLLEARKAREAQDLIDAKAKLERDEAEEARRAEQKIIDDAAMAKAKAEREEAEKERAAAVEKRDEARVQQRQAEDNAAEAKREERTATRDSKQALDSAVRDEKRADRIEQKVDGPDAELARTRSEHGAVATLSRNWVCRITDATKLDYKTLQPFVPLDVWEVCLRKWMLLQPATQEARQMPGAVFEIEVTAQHR